MKKIYGMMLSLAVFGISVNGQSILDIFPDECGNASDREPLPGHFLRVGFISSTAQGLAFFFPDQRLGQSLQMVPVAPNVGLIGYGGVNPGEIEYRTPPGAFVVGQIFVGDQQGEPMVTCLSRPILLSRFVPRYYGFENSWLDRSTFGNWLRYKKYSRWKWRDRWQRDIYSVRTKFSDFRDRNRSRYDRSDRGWRDRKNWKDRDSRRNDRNDRDFGRDRRNDRNDRDFRKDGKDGRNERGGWRSGMTSGPNMGKFDGRPEDVPSAQPIKRKRKLPNETGAMDINRQQVEKNGPWRKVQSRSMLNQVKKQRDRKQQFPDEVRGDNRRNEQEGETGKK